MMEWITIKDAATFSKAHDRGGSEGWILQLINRGKVTARKDGRDWMILKKTLEEYIAKPIKPGRPRKDA